MNFFLSSVNLAEEPVEGSSFVDVGVKDKVIGHLLEEVFSSASSGQVPLPESSLEVEPGVLLETEQHLSFELLIRSQRGRRSSVLDDQVLEAHFFLFSDFAVEHDADSQEEVLQDIRVDLFLFG